MHDIQLQLLGPPQIRRDGQIVAVGRTWEAFFPSREDVALARYSPVTGALDTSLDPDTGGRQLTLEPTVTAFRR